MSSKTLVLSVVVIIAVIALVVFILPELSDREGSEQAQEPEPAEEPVEQAGEQSQGIVLEGGGFLPVVPVVWDNPAEPMESWPLRESEIPKDAVVLIITSQGIFPSSFEALNEQEMILSVTNQDQWTHVLQFESESLNNVAVSVGPGRTRAITFYAPQESGEYRFYCAMPGHKEKGETGKMIVK